MSPRPVRPSSEQLQLLDTFERYAFELADFVNSRELPKRMAQLFLQSVGVTWVNICSRNLVHLLGLEHVRELQPPRGLLLASNHRSLFDQYAIACWLFRTTKLLRKIYFPVRSDFYYDQPLGVLVSLVMSALAMYPPIFRAAHKREFNSYSVERMVELLREPGVVVGMHPEGTRNKGCDPYTLLKAQPGIGKLILEAQPTVLPVFVNGLSNDFVAQVRGNFDGQGQPVIIVFGKPLVLDAFYAKDNRLRTQKELADFVLAEIAALGQRERAYREELARHPRQGPVFA